MSSTKRTETSKHVCGNCGLYFDEGEIIPLEKVKDLFERIDPGEEVPAGECPKCGALAYVNDVEAEDPWIRKGESFKIVAIDIAVRDDQGDGSIEDAIGEMLRPVCADAANTGILDWRYIVGTEGAPSIKAKRNLYEGEAFNV